MKRFVPNVGTANPANANPAALRRASLFCAVLFVAMLAATSLARASAPSIELGFLAPDSVKAGGQAPVKLNITNAGSAPLSFPLVLKETVTPGLSLVPIACCDNSSLGAFGSMETQCQETVSTITCSIKAETNIPMKPGVSIFFLFPQALQVDPGASGEQSVSFEVSGGGAPSVSETHTMTVDDAGIPYGIELWKGALLNPDKSPTRQAGAPPALFETDLLNPNVVAPGNFGVSKVAPQELLKDVEVHLPPGMVGNPSALPKCTLVDLANLFDGHHAKCPADSQVGLFKGLLFGGGQLFIPIYNVEPPPGAPALLAFNVSGSIVYLTAKLRPDDYGIDIVSLKTSTTVILNRVKIEIWGAPTEPIHDAFRGTCIATEVGSAGSQCPSTAPEKSFLRMPTSCSGESLKFPIKLNTYEHPADFHEASFDAPSLAGCDQVPFDPSLSTQPTSHDTETPTGLSVHVEVPNPGLENPGGIASSDVKAVKVALPEGMTVNPSQAEGLGVCAPAQYQSTELSFFPTPGKGCPDDSKIGTVEVHTPLLEETIPGDVYIAKPFDNPFGSLLALYVVLHEPERGILIKLAGKVETDERTGQITTTFENLPQTPFSSFDFKFREGARAPLVTPQSCGTYTTHAEFTPWSNPGTTLPYDSSFPIIHGIGGGPCPSGGLPPFKPGLIAGSLNNAAGHYSPFNVRLFRTDAEQEFTNFSVKLPPGISGKLAGVPFCPEAAIAAAKARTGAEEIAAPSCPAASEVGRTLAGAGVGSVLTYAPGKIYLAGPYNGSALSIVSVTAAKVGPFDLGTVVVRLALRVDPETAEVFVDATGSDPIPHIIDGITVHLRDIRAYVDKPEFTLNPTSCKRTSTASTLLGSGLDFSSAIDDRPVTVSTPYQAADCAALGFKPELKLWLKGGTKRAGHPKLKAVLKMKPGMANIAGAQVTLPKSEFLDQSHIGTVCTRVQYAKDACPAKSIYGYAKAITPILDEPLQGPVYLRSSEHKLPDLVAGLKSGKIEIDLAGRIDSVDGQIRTTFETVPDAPVRSFTLTMAGGKKGLLENSTNLCARPHKAVVAFDAQNGKIRDFNPVVKPDCKKSKHKKAARQKRAAG